jgi:hypothetical protein
MNKTGFQIVCGLLFATSFFGPNMQSMAFRSMRGLRSGSRATQRSFAASTGDAKNPKVFFDLEIRSNAVGTLCEYLCRGRVLSWAYDHVVFYYC